MKRIRQLLIVMLALAMLPIQAFALMDGRKISRIETIPYEDIIAYAPVLQDVVYDEYGYLLPVGEDAELDWATADPHEATWLDQFIFFFKDYDSDLEDTYVAVVRKDAQGKTAYLFTLVEGEPIVLLEIPHPEYVNFFRSHMDIMLYTDGEADYVDLSMTNSYPATDEGPSFDESHSYFKVHEGELEEVDEIKGEFMQSFEGSDLLVGQLEDLSYLEDEYLSWKELDQLARISFSGDTSFLEGVDPKEQGDFLRSLVPLFSDWNRPLGDGFDLDVVLNLLRQVAIDMSEELNGWGMGDNMIRASGEDGYFSMEDALEEADGVAREHYVLGYPEGDGLVIDGKPFADYMQKRYNQSLPEGTYAPEDCDVGLTVDSEGTLTAFANEVFAPMYIFPETIESKGDYAILKASLYGLWGAYASEGWKISETGYFLLHKVAGEDGPMIQTIYRSDDPFDFDDVKELMTEQVGTTEKGDESAEVSQRSSNVESLFSNKLPLAVGFAGGAIVVAIIAVLIRRKK